ncbi:DUF2786 domain-containing protein [Deltaproteobacteria bacterium TL4]
MVVDLSDEKREKIIRQIQQLLKFEGKSTEAETQAAMAKVEELLVKYQLDMQEIQGLSESLEDRFTEGRSSKAPVNWTRKFNYILNILQSYFFVKIVKSNEYQEENDEYRGKIRFFGRKTNTEIAKYVYEFLDREFERLWKQFYQRTGATRRYRNDYLLGLYIGLDAILRESKKKTEEKYALVVIDESSELNQFVKEQLPNLASRASSRDFYRSEAVLGAGIQAGRSIRIHQGLQDAELELIG